MSKLVMDSLNGIRCQLIENVTLSPMFFANLRTDHTLTDEMQQVIESKITTHGRVDKLLDTLARRGPNAKNRFIEALKQTGQYHVVRLIETGKLPTPEEKILMEKSLQKIPTIFHSLAAKLASMKPKEIEHARSDPQPITTITPFLEKTAASGLGISEIPFVMAVYSGLFTQQSVLSFPDPPTKSDLERQLKIYESECQEIDGILKSFQFGGIHIICRPIEPTRNVWKFLVSLNKPFLIFSHEGINLLINSFEYESFTSSDRKIIIAVMHLMSFGNTSFIFRKTNPPQPNVYLFQNATCLAHSNIIPPREADIVREAINRDESIPVTPRLNQQACPW